MTVNKIQITIPRGQDKVINLPIKLDWELLDTENEINALENEIFAEVAGRPIDFETNRFAHSGYTASTGNLITYNTDINYQFYFFSGGTLTTSASTPNWILDYRSEGFTTDEIYYFSDGFEKSFWKLDFYDSPSDRQQTNFLTIVLPTTQGERMPADMQGTAVTIKKPVYKLDYTGDKEGFFIYWLKSRTTLDLDKFFMSCKFWNAKTGSFSQMINKPQSLNVSNAFNANSLFDFYYQVNLDYEQQTYVVYETTTFQRVGTNTNPIKWYEYVNP
jgi:hypothetical protein